MTVQARRFHFLDHSVGREGMCRRNLRWKGTGRIYRLRNGGFVFPGVGKEGGACVSCFDVLLTESPMTCLHLPTTCHSQLVFLFRYHLPEIP